MRFLRILLILGSFLSFFPIHTMEMPVVKSSRARLFLNNVGSYLNEKAQAAMYVANNTPYAFRVGSKSWGLWNDLLALKSQNFDRILNKQFNELHPLILFAYEKAELSLATFPTTLKSYPEIPFDEVAQIHLCSCNGIIKSAVNIIYEETPDRKQHTYRSQLLFWSKQFAEGSDKLIGRLIDKGVKDVLVKDDGRRRIAQQRGGVVGSISPQVKDWI